MRFFAPLVHALFHIGYFGPFLMGILDSSFLVLPFGNDILVVAMVLHYPAGAPWYVLSAASGSSVGAFLLASVSKRFGEEGIRKISGRSRHKKLKQWVCHRSGFAIALAGLAPPPFPFTIVIAAVGALSYPRWRICVINFFARAARFTILSVLALRFGRNILGIAQSSPFKWSMAAFIVLCFVASGFSVAHWLQQSRPRSVAPAAGD